MSERRAGDGSAPEDKALRKLARQRPLTASDLHERNSATSHRLYQHGGAWVGCDDLADNLMTGTQRRALAILVRRFDDPGPGGMLQLHRYDVWELIADLLAGAEECEP